MESGKKLLVGIQGNGEATPSGLHEHMLGGNKRDLPSELGGGDLPLLGSVPWGKEQWGPRYIVFFCTQGLCGSANVHSSAQLQAKRK